MKAWKKLGIFVLIGVFTVGMSRTVWAQQSNSTNYQVDSAYFGSGGELEMTSPGYKASAGAGDSASGSVEGVNFSGQTGSPNSSEPLLEFIIGGGGEDHGQLDPNQTYDGYVLAKVRTYSSSGYIMQVTGTPPKQTVHTIPGIGPAPDISRPTNEQFGLNLRNNSTPDVGDDPQQVPDSSFAYGVPAPDYNEPNKFKYVSGDIIAQSGANDSSGVGETHYTISYILNLSPLTPAGRYEAKLSVVVSAKF